jgi:ketosteroid isomerase-like protein
MRTKARNGTLRAALAAGAAGMAVAGAAEVAEMPSPQVRELVASYEAANAALMKGDAETFMRQIGGMTPDFVLMSPFGGEPSRAADYTPERIQRMGRFFRDGSFNQEVVATYATKDMVVLATIERVEAEVGGLPRQPWALRVTSVFVRHDSRWSLAHRHADPLVEGVTLGEAARLARGDRMATGS